MIKREVIKGKVKCTKCGEVKLLRSFYLTKWKTPTSWCKMCTRELEGWKRYPKDGRLKCSKCKEVKDIQEFSKSNKVYCKLCFLEWKKTWSSRKPRGRFGNYNRKAKLRNKEFNITFEEFMNFWQKPCFYCGDIIETIGLDRVNNEKGYTLGNIVSCCTRCNTMKMQLSQKEFINHCLKIINKLGV